MTLFDSAAKMSRRFGPVGSLAARTIEFYGQAIVGADRVAMAVLSSRLEATNRAAPLALGASSTARPAALLDPAEIMNSLLTRSLEQNPDESRREYHAALLGQLVPDEARIVASLAQQGPAPLIAVYKRGSDELLLENASMIGWRAAVTLPSLTIQYVTRLMSLGVVEVGPEDAEDKHGYEVLMGDRDVLTAMKAGARGKIPARVVRSTVRLSPRGHQLFAATRGTQELQP
jgi:hypothetical protein